MNPKELAQEGAEGARSTRGRRIVLATFGSLGDLHPFVALAKELQARGHVPVLATSEFHRERIERLALRAQTEADVAALTGDIVEMESAWTV